MIDDDMTRGIMRQEAPNPQPLRDLVGRLCYKDGWTFDLRQMDRGQGSIGYTLVITVECEDSYGHRGTIRVTHYHPVPPASYHEHSWRRWLLDRIIETETHEACEFLTFDVEPSVQYPDGFVKPFAPHHGPGSNPYVIHDRLLPDMSKESAR